MSFLFDHNLSPTLVNRLADVFADAVHTSLVDLSTADDIDVWEYARSHGLVIVTKDADFEELSLTLGAPPKVIRIAIGNCTTLQIEMLIRSNAEQIRMFIEAADLQILLLR